MSRFSHPESLLRGNLAVISWSDDIILMVFERPVHWVNILRTFYTGIVLHWVVLKKKFINWNGSLILSIIDRMIKWFKMMINQDFEMIHCVSIPCTYLLFFRKFGVILSESDYSVSWTFSELFVQRLSIWLFFWPLIGRLNL